MTQKIAVSIIHGMGNQDTGFADKISVLLKEEFSKQLGKVVKSPTTDQLEIEPVYWAPDVQGLENALWNKVGGGQLDWKSLRSFVVSYLGDAVAYQATPSKDGSHSKEIIYEDIHDKFRVTLKNLASRAGENAPLCVIAHSLGSIITSNFLYDLQVHKQYDNKKNKTALEKGETLTLLYTMGSPIAVWSLRYKDFGVPVQVPRKELVSYYPTLQGEWINFYDKDDILAYPLKNLNDEYHLTIKDDVEVNCGNFIVSHTPLSHNYYWTNKKVIQTISQALVRTWIEVNLTTPRSEVAAATEN